MIAIGGGSTMDLGKGIALLLNNDVPALSLKGFPKNINDPLPLITIPTIFGSGSEVSYNAVFIDEIEGRKLGINTRKNFPNSTLIDPLLTMSAPKKAIISSAMDTLVHCVDSFGDPICNDDFHEYVLELDDATKILNDKNGDPVNFSEIPLDQFLQAREYVDNDQIEKILEM